MLKKLAISVVLVIFSFNQGVLASDFRFSPRQNKAHFIQWRQWGKESLEQAKRENKLILLSLSAVWCHWCHVMDETTYSDINVIDYINHNLFPVRVDANMRPDIDNLYNQGGWPSTVLLTPEGEIVQGGTYISQEDMLGWLSRFVEMYRNDEERVKERTETRTKREEDGPQTERGALRSSDITRITQMLESSYDKEYGGFGISQKFPNAHAIDFLLSGYQSRKDPEVERMITTTLENMSKGEIYDSVEGGFFRYSTRPDWSMPHYEKMLELNAELIKNYASAYMIFGNTSYMKVMKETMNYVEKHLYGSRKGAFYGSQDADEDYYKRTNRNRLKPPYVDHTMYADSNAQMITALIAASGATGGKGYLKIAEKTADFIMKNLYSIDDGVFHYYLGGKHLNGLLSDNVLLGLALIDLYNATGESRYMNGAEDIARFLVNRFYDHEHKQFRPTLDTTDVRPSTASTLLDYTSASSNYRAVIFLSRLYYINGSKDRKEIIDGTSAKLRSTYEYFEPSAALYGTALRWSLEEPLVITVIAHDKRARRFLVQANKTYIPEKVVRVLSLKRERGRIKELGYPLAEASYVCWGKKCSPAFGTPEELVRGIKQFMEDIKKKEE